MKGIQCKKNYLWRENKKTKTEEKKAIEMTQ